MPHAFPDRLLIPTLLLLAGCASGGPPEAGPTVADPAVARLEGDLPGILERAEIPGLSVARVRDGRVTWTGAFGVRDADSGAPVTDRTVFQAASLSKPVFAYVVLRLAERGVVDLDRPLAEYRPNPRMAPDPRYRSITARMVLSHSSGLPNWGGDTLDLAFDPGTGFRYSGEGYVYLQDVVESLTGLGLDALARREVFEPLGMTRSGYVWQAAFDDDAAVGHDALGRPRPLQRRDQANAAASLLTTAGDYARFLAAVLEGRGLDDATRTEMLTPVIRTGALPWAEVSNPRMGWGLGWGLETGSPASFWHWGDNGVFKAYVVGVPDRDEAVVYFANSVHGISVAEAVTERALGQAHAGARWVGEEPFDAPGMAARRAVYHAFADHGADAGLVALDSLRRRSPGLAEAGLGVDVAELLLDAENPDAAIALLEGGRWGESAEVADALGRAYLEAGRYEDARDTYRRLAARSDSAEVAERFAGRAAWVELRVRAARAPVEVPRERLRELAGRYGPRTVTLEDGVLFYQREGNPRYRLVPLGGETFQPVGIETFRIRFDGPDEGAPGAIIGLYFDGSSDRTPRDPRPDA
jgi:CubicO group peptidase (beta-lactamase class C family)